jgi:hypothetical protein
VIVAKTLPFQVLQTKLPVENNPDLQAAQRELSEERHKPYTASPALMW